MFQVWPTLPYSRTKPWAPGWTNSSWSGALPANLLLKLLQLNTGIVIKLTLTNFLSKNMFACVSLRFVYLRWSEYLITFVFQLFLFKRKTKGSIFEYTNTFYSLIHLSMTQSDYLNTYLCKFRGKYLLEMWFVNIPIIP